MTEELQQPQPSLEAPNPISSTPETQTTPPVSTPAPEPLTADALVLPEGFTLDETSSKTFLDIMNNGDMSPVERANALVQLQVDLATKSSEAGSQAWNDQQQAWQQEVHNDPTLGGQNLPKTIEAIGNLMDRYGNDEVRAAFDQTGAGNNPHVVRFLHALSQQLREASPAAPGGPAGQGTRSLEQRLYPNMTS